MGSHGVTCHPADVRIPPLPPAEASIVDLATPEGCKAELTYVMWKRAGWELNPRPVSRKSIALPQRHHARNTCLI